MRTFIIALLACVQLLIATSVHAQLAQYAAAKEKVYVHTSHVFFSPGETVYFKIYVVNAADQKPGILSNVVYVEMINPSGNVVEKQNYRVENGYAEGSFQFGDQLPGGIYKLKAYTTWMRNEKDSSFFVKELTVQQIISPRILMKLDFPRKGYGGGDEVSAQFSMRSLNDQPIKHHTGKFTVALNGASVQTGDFTTDAEGKANIKFVLPAKLSGTDGLLHITVSYDGYTESISRSIPIVLHHIDLQFMPEGGALVEGIPAYVGFKALNEQGKPADIKGEIIDDKGNHICSFESVKFGMGKFLLTPVHGRSYQARITTPADIEGRFLLPAAAKEGVVMSLTEKSEKIQVQLTATADGIVKLVGQTKSITYFTKNFSLKKGVNRLEVNEDLFPTGIAQFTLYTKDGLPLAERLLFLNEQKNLNVAITSDKKKYLPREKVKLDIKTTDEHGKPVPSNLSLSVVDDKLWTLADDKQDHILSWLLLSSELKGKIEEPLFYFKKDEPKAAEALDLLMLTQGYRYFDYIEEVAKEGQLRYAPDQDNILNGKVTAKDGKGRKATLFLVEGIQGGKAIRATTDEEGNFYFSQLLPQTRYYLFAQGINKREKLNIQVLQNGIGYNPMSALQGKDLPARLQDMIAVNQVQRAEKAPQPKARENLMNNLQALGMGQHNLNEVVVVGYATQLKKMITGSVATIQARDMVAPGTVNNMLEGRVAGLMVVQAGNPGDAARIAIRGVRSIADVHQPLIVVDGIPMENFNLERIDPADIDNITVLKDASATALYGSKGAYGVIAIELKKAGWKKIRWQLNKDYFYASQAIMTSGTAYTVARHFYAPRYTSLETDKRDDFRQTIYWNPVVQTDKNGKAELSFYNSDANTTFRIIAEGIGYNGKAGRAEQTYSVQNAITADVKIPPYLTVGDRALLPLVIKNNHRDVQTLSIALNLPSGMVSEKFDSVITVKPDSTIQVLIPVAAKQYLKDTIQFVIHGESGTEVLALPVTASEKGFPVIETISGNKSGQHAITISHMVPGSLRTGLKIFRDPEGQLLDGIESMLREPYGCFEQTSSSTYPNIMVLKYLKESGKSNPQIQNKALDYINRGYQRLIGFETAQNGFEWFGKTPPHEALTAYGLLEFTDMKEFIHVDEQMLDRTKKFLLSRRDGKGGFKLAGGGYDQFAAVPDKIANVYIVYALTQAGIGKEILPEYAAAVKKAQQSNDGYQLALMANAAANMRNSEDYQALMKSLNKLYASAELPSETSVVNSRENSLKVETLSLYALALMRDPSVDVGRLADVVTAILSKKCYYGYGSTQSTVLALQAIVAYRKVMGDLSHNSSVVFKINESEVTEQEALSGQLHEGQNRFSIQYQQEDKALPFSLEVAYNTLTPPNSEKAQIKLSTTLSSTNVHVGESVRMQIEVKNTVSGLQPMTLAKIGIPAGLSLQPWQLKEIMDQNKVAYYEIFDNYLVLYWMGFRPAETKTINLDLKADIPGHYKGKASTTYLYYTPEYKNWNEGLEVEIRP